MGEDLRVHPQHKMSILDQKGMIGAWLGFLDSLDFPRIGFLSGQLDWLLHQSTPSSNRECTPLPPLPMTHRQLQHTWAR